MSITTALSDSRAFALALPPLEKAWTVFACAFVIFTFAIYHATPAASATQAISAATAPYATFVDGVEGEPPPWPPAPSR